MYYFLNVTVCTYNTYVPAIQKYSLFLERRDKSVLAEDSAVVVLIKQFWIFPR